MHLVSDYIHPTPMGLGVAGAAYGFTYLNRSMTRPWWSARHYPYNGGASVTYATQQLAAEVIRSHELPTPLVWIEHWPKDTTRGGEETFELVVFSGYEVEERAPYLGETSPGLDSATWKSLDRATVEIPGRVVTLTLTSQDYLRR